MAISNRLQNAYQRAVTETQLREIFLAIMEYLELYLSDPKLEPATDAIWDSMLQNHELRETYRLAAVEELRKFANGKRLELDSSELEAVTRILKNISAEGQVNAETIFNDLSKISDAFDSVIKATTLPHYEAYKGFNLKNKAKPVHLLEQSRENLLLHYRCFHHYETYRPSLAKSLNPEGLIYYDNLHEEMNSLAMDKSDGELQYLSLATLRVDLQRWHSNLTDFLTTRVAINIETAAQIPETGWAFDPETVILELNGRRLKFHAGKDNAEIMTALTRNVAQSQVWSWKEIYSVIGDPVDANLGMHDKKDLQKVLEQKYKGINARIQARIGYENFLIFDLDKVRINPRYLKKP